MKGSFPYGGGFFFFPILRKGALSRGTAHSVTGPRQRPDEAHWNETTKELLPFKMRLAYHPRDGKLLAIPLTMGQDSICREEKKSFESRFQ